MLFLPRGHSDSTYCRGSGLQVTVYLLVTSARIRSMSQIRFLCSNAYFVGEVQELGYPITQSSQKPILIRKPDWLNSIEPKAP